MSQTIAHLSPKKAAYQIARSQALLQKFKSRHLSPNSLVRRPPLGFVNVPIIPNSSSTVPSKDALAPDAAKAKKQTVLVPRLLNPFLLGPRSPITHRKDSPKYSLRRQKELLKAAKLLAAGPSGNPQPHWQQMLPLSPKGLRKPREGMGGGIDKALKELHRMNWKARGIPVAGVTERFPAWKPYTAPPVEGESAASTTSSSSAKKASKWTNGRINPNRPAIWIGEPKPRSKISLYEGRKKFAFKTHIWEREKPARDEFIRKRVSAMNFKMKQHRRVSLVSLVWTACSGSLVACY